MTSPLVSISKDEKTEKVRLLPCADLNSQICNDLYESNILGIINGIYDPIGLASSTTIKLRVAFRTLFQANSTLGSNDVILDKDFQDSCLSQLVEAVKISFPWATLPTKAVRKPQLICCFDGSEVAYATVIYIRWILLDQTVKVSLLSSKAHVTPLNRILTPWSVEWS